MSLAGEALIAPASLEDVWGIQEVIYRTWRATYPNAEYAITVEDIDKRFADRHAPEKLKRLAYLISYPSADVFRFVAKSYGKVLGVCFVLRSADRNDLKVLYVLPEYQRKGIGGKLWKAAERCLNPENDTYLTVASYNDTAIEFYRKLGFVDTGPAEPNPLLVMPSGAAIPELGMVKKGLVLPVMPKE